MPVASLHRRPRCLGDLIDLRGCSDDVARFLQPLQLGMQFHLFDLAAMDEAQVEDLRLSAVGDLTLRFLQFLRHRPPASAADDILRWRHVVARLLGHPRGKEVLAALFSWWLAGAPASVETLRTVMTKIQQENAPMHSLLDLLLDMGEERGLQRGMQQGFLAGLRGLVAGQLRARFGALPPAADARLAAADAESLQRWGQRLLSAAQLDDVFAAP